MSMAMLGNLQDFQPNSGTISEYLTHTKALLCSKRRSEWETSCCLSECCRHKDLLTAGKFDSTRPSSRQAICGISNHSSQPFWAQATCHWGIIPTVLQKSRTRWISYRLCCWIETYLAHCKFGVFLNYALCDQVVRSVRNESTEKQMLSESDLTFKRTSELAQGMEVADKNTRASKGMETFIKKMWPLQWKWNEKWVLFLSHSVEALPCSRCGQTNHDA